MVSYLQTPLFPIQEAVNSENSLPPPLTLAKQQMATNREQELKLQTILQNYKQSEREYLVELKTLYSVVKNFDPIYNSYYDGSLDDITDDMVDQRKGKNDTFKKMVHELVNKHTELEQILKLPEIETVLLSLSNWSTGIIELYSHYVDFYKLDVSQCKTEIKIRRRPLIRIRYLNNFFRSLKDIIIEMGERPYTAPVLSSFEVLIFKLANCLEKSRRVDELEKKKCEDELYTINAKDLVHLQPVLSDVRQEQLDQEYQCDLHYLNQPKSAKLNFKNISVVTLKNAPIEQLAILQRDTFGKHLLFTPLRKNELTLHMTRENHGKSLVFSHSVLKEQIKLCFSFTEHTNPELSSILLNYFPKYVPSAAYSIPKFGLGIKFGNDVKEIETAMISEQAPIAKIVASSNKEVVHKSRSADFVKEEEIRFTEQTNTTVKDTPLYLKFASNENLIVSQSNTNHSCNITKAPLNTNKEAEISKKFLHLVTNNESSDEEDDAESIVSETTAPLNIAPIQQLPTPPEKHVETYSNKEETEEPEQVKEEFNSSTYRTFNFEKYHDSLTVETKPKRKSIFGSFTNLLSRKNNKTQLKPKRQSQLQLPPQPTPYNSLNSKAPVSTFSLQSMSSVLSVSQDPKIQSILNKSSSKSLPPAAVALWNANNWTKSKDLHLVLHSIENSEFYAGFYEKIAGEIASIPLLLLELTSTADCMFNTIDIHLKAKNVKGNDVTVSIRPLNGNDMKIIGNALVNPELLESILNNSTSVSSALSTKTVLSEETTGTSIDEVCEETCENVAKTALVSTGPPTVETRKSWTGVGDLKLVMNSKKFEDLNRCVVSVTKKGDLVNFDLTGFEFGNIELKVDCGQIKLIKTQDVLINGKQQGVYLLSLDSVDDIVKFKECVY